MISSVDILTTELIFNFNSLCFHPQVWCDSRQRGWGNRGVGDGPAEALVWREVRHFGVTVTPQHWFHGPAGWGFECWIHIAQQSHTGKQIQLLISMLNWCERQTLPSLLCCFLIKCLEPCITHEAITGVWTMGAPKLKWILNPQWNGKTALCSC